MFLISHITNTFATSCFPWWCPNLRLFTWHSSFKLINGVFIRRFEAHENCDLRYGSAIFNFYRSCCRVGFYEGYSDGATAATNGVSYLL